MAPLPSSPTPSPIPPPVPVATHPNRGAFKPPGNDPSRLAPNDAYYSPPRLRPLTENKPVGILNSNGSAAASAAAAALRPAVASLRPPPAIPIAARIELDRKKARSISRKRRAPTQWKKLLWVKNKGYPDNYTDTETFLDHLQRNPRLRPYDFWPLVADSTVIVQHVSSVVVFVCCFVGISREQISPVSVVGWGSFATVLGYCLWDYWVGKQESEVAAAQTSGNGHIDNAAPGDRSSTSSGASSLSHALTVNGHVKENHKPNPGLGLTLTTSNLSNPSNGKPVHAAHYHSTSATSFQSVSPITPIHPSSPSDRFPPVHLSMSQGLQPLTLTPRTQSRLKTLKSALLIYFALLGLSPILKSLTKSTTSDSIWALATWLMIINIFFFDYGGLQQPRSDTSGSATTPATAVAITPSAAFAPSSGAVGSQGSSAATFPASLSTNAALMASTVLASRLTSTTHVFSLTLFSIEVFGLFPVFRRHLKHVSFRGHLILTAVLVVAAGGGVGAIWGRGWWSAILGVVVGSGGTGLVMGGCSLWLISLQRYKNVVIGPWDPARPVLHTRGRGGTDP